MKTRYLLVSSLLAAQALSGAEVDESKLPKPAEGTVDFTRDIQPIFEASCLRCHGPEKPKSKFRLDNRESALKGGDNGVAIMPGNSAKSPLIHYVAGISEEFEMPPKGKGDPLTSKQVALLRSWIDQGAKWPEGQTTATNKYYFSFVPTAQYITVSGNERTFREHYWMREGWSGGAQEFRVEDRMKDGTKVKVEGRALANQDDFKVKLSLEKEDFGFTRFGYEQFRKYYNDSGAYYAGDPTSPYVLDRDLTLDVGRAYVDFGLTLPDWPRMVLGYEYQYREGTKSSLVWSFGNAGVALVPTPKDVDERTHILKFDIDHEISGVRLADTFRGEFYTMSNARTTPGIYDREAEHHFQGANAFTAEKQLRDWLFVSGGYLFSRLDGNAGFTQELFNVPDPTVVGLGDVGTGIIIERTAHVLNANSMLGPWEGLSFFGGLQTEWNKQQGMGWGSFYGTPLTPYNADSSRSTIDEHFGLRYTTIPYTVLFADTRFQQESIGRYETQTRGNGDAHDFISDIDSGSDLKEYKVGFTFSPWVKGAFDGSFKHSDKRSNYDPRVDFDLSLPPAIPGNGYPGYIRSRDLSTDEIETKFTLRPASWWKTTLKYQLTSTDYHTTTDPYDDGSGTGTLLGGGEIYAGNYDAHTFSINNSLTPWRRLSLSATFSYTMSRIVSGVNDDAIIVPYKGNIYSVISSANFVLNDKIDLHSTYTFSLADYGQNNVTTDLPLGLAYERHAVMSGITRRFKKFITTGLQYGFFYYNEPTSNGVNDYVAHAVIGTLTMALP